MKKVEKSEYNGYGVLANLSFKINKVLANFARYFFNLSNKFKFEQYKIIFGEREDDIYISISKIWNNINANDLVPSYH